MGGIHVEVKVPFVSALTLVHDLILVLQKKARLEARSNFVLGFQPYLSSELLSDHLGDDKTEADSFSVDVPCVLETSK